MTTPKLSLPELAQSQSQPHVPINTAHRTLEALVQLSVLDRDLTTPPATPASDAYYIVAGSASGAWEAHDMEIAYVVGGAWVFAVPIVGWLAFVQDEGRYVEFDGADWVFHPSIDTLFNAANDAAAAAGGVPVGAMYRNGSVLMIRVA